MNIEQIKSKFIKDLWNILDANKDGVIDNNDKAEIEKQNSKETIDQYFPKALELVRQYIDDIRTGIYGKRNLT